MNDPLDPTPALPAVPADAPAPPATRDAHGFDPADYDWVPVPRQRRRADGWTQDTQREFIEALADTGLVTEAARAVGMSPKSCYALRRAPDGQGFARAWDAAMDQAGKALLDVAFERVLHGEDVPVFDKNGQRIASRRRYPNGLIMFMLRGYFPDRFGGAEERGRPARPRTVEQPAALPPVASALAALEPVRPDAPHTLMPPDELAEFIAAERFNAEEQERFRGAHPELAAREDAGESRPVRASVETVAAPWSLAEETDWDKINAWAAEREAEAARAARRAKRAASRAHAADARDEPPTPLP